MFSCGFKNKNRTLLSELISKNYESKVKKECPNCGTVSTLKEISNNLYCCPECEHHFRINSRKRIGAIFDKGSFEELFSNLTGSDFMEFPGYYEKLKNVREKSGENEAVICGIAKIQGIDCAVFAMEPEFMMGSMGVVVGEKIARIFEYAVDNNLPVIGFTASGGARMQEGILSLMQMAKTSAVIKRFSNKGLLYIAVLTNPTTGGVTASFGMEGDIILAEPGAMVGFAGARVIEQVTRKKLPEGFQKSEFILEHGFADKIVSRKNQRRMLGKLLSYHGTGVDIQYCLFKKSNKSD